MAKDVAGDAPARPSSNKARRRKGAGNPVFGAIDLGTNNCRMLMARRAGRGFRVVDAYSRIVRLGEGLTHSGALSESAMDRAIEALKVCSDRLSKRRASKIRAIATEACRAAENGEEFLARAREATGLPLELITSEEEARLAVQGSLDLLDEAKTRPLSSISAAGRRSCAGSIWPSGAIAADLKAAAARPCAPGRPCRWAW